MGLTTNPAGVGALGGPGDRRRALSGIATFTALTVPAEAAGYMPSPATSTGLTTT